MGDVRTASNAPPVSGNRMGIPNGPGLGIAVRPDLLGAPFLDDAAILELTRKAP
jgi:cis-L-3-hydroxyproline dehydratase